jgi:hypothetical protein
VRDGEEAFRVGGEDRFLFRQVGGADGQDRAGGRLLVAEALDVRLAVRALPGEHLAAHMPGAVTAELRHPLGHLGELARDAGHVVEGLHALQAPSGASR